MRKYIPTWAERKELRRQELDYIVKINNQWAYKAYKYSKKNVSIKIISYLTVALSIIFSQWDALSKLLEGF